jgi:hypothetical protein
VQNRTKLIWLRTVFRWYIVNTQNREISDSIKSLAFIEYLSKNLASETDFTELDKCVVNKATS